MGARLASSAVVPLVRKLFTADGPGAGLVNRPVKISGLVTFRGEKRSLGERELQKITAELVRRAVASAGAHERPVSADEEAAVAIALARTVQCLGNLDMDDVQAVQLGHKALAKRLRDTDPHTTYHLSDDAARLHDALLEVACLHILHFFTQRSTFVARTLVGHSSQLADSIARIDLLLERTPSLLAEDTMFEARYAEHIINKHGTLTIYGIDFTNSPDEWPLDTAYLSLEVGVNERGRQAPIRAEYILAGRDRALLRGVAGSGKTTLVQWLAVTTARQGSDNGRHLAPLSGRVPFVLALRTLTHLWHDLPTPGRFLAAVRSPLAEAQPRGWTDRVLRAGRGLLLVDGVDEVPEKVRERTKVWLRDLISMYPDNLWLITSRPSAVRDRWLEAQGFTELSLAPMSRGDVTHFIRRWHTAARSGDDAERQLLDAYEQSLTAAVRTKGDLSRRDIERDMSAIDGIELTEEPKTQFLQRLAYKFLLNGKSELERTQAERIIAQTLPSVSAAVSQGTAQEVFRHLLLRSGVLREPVPGTIDFIHRTFQDYLGAKAAVEEGDLALLVLRAADSQWEDVIRMAIAHARPSERAELLAELIARGDTASTHRRRTQLHLLAMASLEHATQLAPSIRTEVERRASALIPPKSVSEARDLAQVGPVVLELLPGPEGLEPEAATLTVQTAMLIGGDAAIPILARYADHPDLGVRTQLAIAWHHFDTDQYAEDVISQMAGEDIYFDVLTLAELGALQNLGGRARLRIGEGLGSNNLVAGIVHRKLTHLWLQADQSVTWYWLAAFSQLHTLILDHSATPVDLSSLAAHPTLRTIGIHPDQILVDAGSLHERFDVIDASRVNGAT
ncbi:ATP-binding protein [Streptomyces lunaelactis]|uniref:ATP-binding protein n=1 Tax=Streptomyces lunaelactis TaxID=1535768 RepID=A0A2R4TFI2_9ACTN|nr:ATP-binding protein [Streptomyces lunaelactis]NUK83272.1 NACHT domain-containing protein [Streptomyces lunaelactis]